MEATSSLKRRKEVSCKLHFIFYECFLYKRMQEDFPNWACDLKLWSENDERMEGTSSIAAEIHEG